MHSPDKKVNVGLSYSAVFVLGNVRQLFKLTSVISALFVYFPVQTYGEGSNVRLCVNKHNLTDLIFHCSILILDTLYM